MNTHSPKTSRRPSRRALRRRQIARNVAWALSGVFVLGAFAGGILWRHSKVNRATAEVVAPETSDEQRTAALGLFDEAVRARYEERAQGAMNAITAARHGHTKMRDACLHPGRRDFAFDQLTTAAQRDVVEKSEELHRGSDTQELGERLTPPCAGRRRAAQRQDRLGLFCRRSDCRCFSLVRGLARGQLHFVLEQRSASPRLLTMQGGQQMPVRLASVAEEAAQFAVEKVDRRIGGLRIRRV